MIYRIQNFCLNPTRNKTKSYNFINKLENPIKFLYYSENNNCIISNNIIYYLLREEIFYDDSLINRVQQLKGMLAGIYGSGDNIYIKAVT